MKLLALALAPVLILLSYVFIRDRYEKEPWRLLIVGTIFGVTITYPIIQVENLITTFLPITGIMGEALFSGFCVAAFTETAFKFIVLYLLTWNNRNLNERFDGIVYSVFIALGFAGLENVLYVFHEELGGAQTALIRAVLSVPAHMLFAVMTGYYFAMGKFVPERRAGYLLKAFFITWFIHGVYDFVLLSDMPYYLLLLVPLMIWMWFNGLRQMKKHIGASPFKNLRKEKNSLKRI